MILRAKHLVLGELIPFSAMMVAFFLSEGIAKWYFYSIAIIAGFAIYFIVRKYPDSNTIILESKGKGEAK